MKIAVTDASIFIDLIHIDWVGHLPKVEYEIITTYEVLAELYDWQQALLEEMIQENKLAVHAVPEDALNTWKAGFPIAKRLSRPDITMLWLAAQMGALVLTSDKVVRSTAAKLQLETHGILWLLDQFIGRRVVSAAEACAALEALLEINDRLPREECAERLERWRK